MCVVWVPRASVHVGGLASLARPSVIQGDARGTIAAPPLVPLDPRAERKRAKDYRTLVNVLLPLAKAGSASAQYEIASALHYCEQNLYAHFISRATRAPKTNEEIRRNYEKLDDVAQQQFSESYEDCHALLNDLDSLKSSTDWLDRAAEAGYPPAIFAQADLKLQTSVIKGDSAGIDQARQSAIFASTSADPEVLFGMATFVTGAGKTQTQAAQLMSAWWLVGCERGYDCSAQSEWIQSNCIDPQCANKPTVVEELQRMNGAAFGEVQQLADQINAAIDSRDREEIKKYL